MTVRLLERAADRRWVQVEGGAEEARARMPASAWQLLALADECGLAVHVWGQASTDIIGTVGHKLTLGHRLEPGQARRVRIRLARLNGVTIESRVTPARAREWIGQQPRPLRRAPATTIPRPS